MLFRGETKHDDGTANLNGSGPFFMVFDHIAEVRQITDE